MDSFVCLPGKEQCPVVKTRPRMQDALMVFQEEMESGENGGGDNRHLGATVQAEKREECISKNGTVHAVKE